MHRVDLMDLKNVGTDIHVTSGQVYRELIQLAKVCAPGVADRLYLAAKACAVLSECGAQVVDIANQPH